MEYSICGCIANISPQISLWAFLLMSVQSFAQAVETDLEKDIAALSQPSRGEVVLTPYWGTLTFAEGETVIVDCGVNTDGQPQDFDITWSGPNGKPLNNTNRSSTQRQDKWSPSEPSAGAYSVSTLVITGLTAADRGRYTCTVKQSTGSGTPQTANFTLRVEQADALCGFEGTPNVPYLCGWSRDNKSSVTWHVHTGGDDVIINRDKGARFDHTYGPSKHIGHFLDLDPTHADDVDKNGTARLTSPTYSKHTDYKCLQLWYIYRGKDSGSLRVSLHNASDPDHTAQVLWSVTEDQGNEWNLARVDLDPQTRDYHILVEAVCKESCRRAVTAIDDIAIVSGKCSDAPDWPKTSLKVRLVGGSQPTEGRVEILHDGQWGSVCSKDFGKKEANVICNSLGYSSENATRCRNAHFGHSPPGSMIWLERLGCTKEMETDVASCIIAGETWGDTDCTHQEDAGIICSAEPVECAERTKPTTALPITTLKIKTKSPSTPRPTTPIRTTPTTTLLSGSTLVPTLPVVKLTKKPTQPNEPVVSPTQIPTTQTLRSTVQPKSTSAKPFVTSKPQATSAKAIPKNISTTKKTQTVPLTATVPYQIISSSSNSHSPTKGPEVVPTSPSPGTPKPTGISSANSPAKLTSLSPTRKKILKDRTTPMVPALTSTPPPLGSTTTGAHFVSPDNPKVPTATQSSTQKVGGTKPAVKTNPDIVSLPPEVEQYNPGNNAGVAIGIIFAVVIASSGIAILLYKRKRKGKKSTYITFGNPSYSREHLPANDFSLESPLTLSSNGYTVLA